MLIESEELKAWLNTLIEINALSIKYLSASMGKVYLGDKFENLAFKKCLIKIAELEQKHPVLCPHINNEKINCANCREDHNLSVT